jgi:uncharacterized protein (DUF885 family)
LCAFGASAAPSFNTWADAFTAEWVRADPQLATSTQYFTGAEQDALDRQLAPVTREHRAARVAKARKGLKELSRFDRSKLDATERVSAAMLEWHLKDVVEAAAFEDHHFVFNQEYGLHVDLMEFLTQMHPIRNRRDVENYLARLAVTGQRIDEGILIARDAARRGFLMPRFITESAIGQFDRLIAPESGRQDLVVSLEERAAKVPGLTPSELKSCVARAQKIVAASVVPAFKRARTLLQEQLPRTTDDAGLWRLPRGEAAYAAALRRYTTTDLTPEEVHALGLKEVARIEAEMLGLFHQLGYTSGSIQERYAQLDANLQPPADPDPRPALLKQYEDILRDAEQRTDALFDLKPKAPLIVKREPAYSEQTASAHYGSPARDGSRPGVFWAVIPGPTYEMPEMRTLAYHEGIPGHHFQIAIQQEMSTLPRFRSEMVFGFISAHGEGWALYAEHLAAESGWYEGDVAGHLGQLSDELFRARRLVVDTGLHVKHWTRQQAIDYGMPASEVERYVVWPGQACSYKVGQLKLLALRAKMQEALGNKYSIKAFHNVVLSTGGVPLAVLEDVVAEATRHMHAR